jgi:hypothetical protein
MANFDMPPGGRAVAEVWEGPIAIFNAGGYFPERLIAQCP